MTHRLTIVAVATLATAASAAFAGSSSAPYNHEFNMNNTQANTARVILPAQNHPGVAVSRSLSAQPVHPHLVQVVLNNSIRTYIDPARRLRSLDREHSLRRAQRLHNSLTGMTTTKLNALRNTSLAQPSKSNRAMVILPTAPQPAVEVVPATASRAVIQISTPNVTPKPKRKSVPIPSVPKQPKNLEAGEKLAEKTAADKNEV